MRRGGRKTVIERIVDHVSAGRYEFTEYSLERCWKRKVRPEEIADAILNGEIVERYPHDQPYPRYLLLIHTENGDPLHVVVALAEAGIQIITVYHPEEEKWEYDRIRKVR